MLLKKIIGFVFIISLSFLLAYFIDRYYIAGKGWGFVLEWIK